ncbi:MAG: hypothetical protein ACI9VS_000604 [Candidatus Binatia bacterium]|jgi:hypothetical protein
MDESNTANWLSECGMWIVLPIVLASALLGVLLGDYKGRSADGFMLGLLFGPAGLIFLYYLKPKSLKSFSNEGSDSHSNTKRQHRSDGVFSSVSLVERDAVLGVLFQSHRIGFEPFRFDW